MIPIELAMAEALNNVAEHAYAERRDGWVAMQIAVAQAEVCLSIFDRGAALPDGGVPSREPNPEGMAIADLPEGGFGWYLMRTLARRVDHCRMNGMNQLTMTFDR